MNSANCTLLAETLKDGMNVKLFERNNRFHLLTLQPDDPQFGELENIVSPKSHPIGPAEARSFFYAADSKRFVTDEEFREMLAAGYPGAE